MLTISKSSREWLRSWKAVLFEESLNLKETYQRSTILKMIWLKSSQIWKKFSGQDKTTYHRMISINGTKTARKQKNWKISWINWWRRWRLMTSLRSRLTFSKSSKSSRLSLSEKLSTRSTKLNTDSSKRKTKQHTTSRTSANESAKTPPWSRRTTRRSRRNRMPIGRRLRITRRLSVLWRNSWAFLTRNWRVWEERLLEVAMAVEAECPLPCSMTWRLLSLSLEKTSMVRKKLSRKSRSRLRHN